VKTPPDSGFTFEEVRREELELLKESQDAPGLDSGDVSDQLMGLAFSGGGIRSATFNLGVLQALSELKLLAEFDYLSTVSGGGYIGSWLSAWIHRSDARNLEQEEETEKRTGRRPQHTPGVLSVQERLSLKEHPDDEPPEVSFLRSYSNYLTPKTGIFSSDTLAAVATYLRNLILNLSILLFCLTVVLLVPRMAAWIGLSLKTAPGALFGFALVGLTVAILFINLNLASQLPNSRTRRDRKRLGVEWRAPWYTKRGAVLLAIVMPLALAAISLSFWLAFRPSTLAEDFLSTDRASLLRNAAIVVGMTGAIGLIWLFALRVAGVKREPGDRPTWRWRLGALAIGLAIGLLAVLTFHGILLDRPEGAERLWWATVWGLPGLLGVFGLAAVFIVGVSGRQFEEDSREWWSRLGGVLFGVVIGWIVVGGIAIQAPFWVMVGAQELKGLVQSLGIAWLVTTVAGVRAAMGGSTGKPGSPTWRDLLATATPYIFLVGLLVTLAYGVHRTLGLWLGPGGSVTVWSDYTRHVTAWLSAYGLLLPFLLSVVLAAFFSWRIDVNVFAFHMFYRNRLVRCYLGASNPRRAPHPFTGFDGEDSLALKALRHRPYHLINGAMNITTGTRLAWQERKAASFIASPLFCGYELKDDTRRTGTYQRTADFLADENTERRRRAARVRERLGLPPTDDPDSGELNMALGTALAVSGAAASPNQGYHSSPAVAFLMTVFNVRLGWWLQNPAKPRKWRTEGPRWGIMYLLSELLGMADETSRYVYISDGGHFENLGLYELVRRRCRFIVACDAGMDPAFEFEDLGNAIRKCKVDLGVSIDIDTRPLRPDQATGRALAHCAVGTIRYERARGQMADGYLLYIKPCITGGEPGDVLQYRSGHAAFPHESTSDQWFGESQFESYRRLGYHSAKTVFESAGVSDPRRRERMFVALKEHWYPASPAVKASFSRHADRLNTLQIALRHEDNLRFLDGQIYPEWGELMRGKQAPHPSNLSLPTSATDARAGFHFCNNLLELMQNVYLDLDLEQDHDHPDNRGWMNLFKHWSWATMLRATYAICCSTYGARFQTFCERRLDLSPGKVSLERRPVSASLDDLLRETQRLGELNFWEAKLIRDRKSAGVPFDELHLLRLKVEDPARAAADPTAPPALEFSFGFALTHQREFVYFRVQDHLRRMGLARDALLALCQAGYTAVSTALAPDDAEAGRRFRVLVSSVLREVTREPRRPRSS
jgi:hypothetical protein